MQFCDLDPTEASCISSAIRDRVHTRPIELPADWDLISSIHGACREIDRIDPYSACYKVPNQNLESYSRLLQAAPEGSTIILFLEERPVAHGWMETWGDEESLYLWRVWVDPKNRNQGIGTALLRWGEAQARRLHAGSDKTAQYLANATEHESDAVHLLRAEGYILNFVSPELSFDSFNDLAAQAPSEGLQIRPVESSQVPQVARGLAEANAPHPEGVTDEERKELARRIEEAIPYFLEQCESSNLDLSRAAWSGDRLAGVILVNMKDRVGEFPQVAVLAEWRGKGLARALANSTLLALKKAGCATVRLFTSIGPDETLPPEGPYAMYVKFGFKPIARHLRFRKPMT